MHHRYAYTPETLAEKWGVSAATVRNLAKAKELRVMHLGRTIRIRPEAVEEYERNQALQAAATAADQPTDGEDDRRRNYTPETLAQRWMVSAANVRSLIRTGLLEAFRVGRQFRITPRAVEEYEARPLEDVVTSPPIGGPAPVIILGPRDL